MGSSRARAVLLILATLALLGLGVRYLQHPELRPGSTPVAGTSDSISAERLDLNTASFKELLRLPRIGPVLAQRIILYRERHGPFRSIEELLNIKGIGKKTLERLRPLLTVMPETEAR